MPLSASNQLSLLYDLLDEQQADRIGYTAEYQQICRLVQALQENNGLSESQLQQLLPEIDAYGQQGETAANSADHITANQQNIENWMSAIQQTTLK
ncbi:YtzH-like family protein [Lentibacillus sediminis]|uniref:YtzH-like family protein n=1 Tax=Lentibacillus sediminis TaxID=1940529 RepID=UPI000C1BCC5F|nr:YtzH-like family protein [Lentibacillus sediminis]